MFFFLNFKQGKFCHPSPACISPVSDDYVTKQIVYGHQWLFFLSFALSFKENIGSSKSSFRTVSFLESGVKIEIWGRINSGLSLRFGVKIFGEAFLTDFSTVLSFCSAISSFSISFLTVNEAFLKIYKDIFLSFLLLQLY